MWLSYKQIFNLNNIKPSIVVHQSAKCFCFKLQIGNQYVGFQMLIGKSLHG
jgi:hypothetical protein